MNPGNKNAESHTQAFESTYGHDGWQASGFAASWISPPAPQRSYADDATAPHREDDHA